MSPSLSRWKTLTPGKSRFLTILFSDLLLNGLQLTQLKNWFLLRLRDPVRCSRYETGWGSRDRLVSGIEQWE